MGVKLSFELDASKVLAKLHRGACQTHDKMFFFNSGILDDQDIAPDQVDKSKISFNLDGSSQYELGVVISEELAAKLANSQEDIMDAAEKNAGKEDKDDNDNKDAKGDKDNKGTKDDKGDNDKDGGKNNDDKDTQAEKDKVDKNTPITEDPTRKINEGFLAFLKEVDAPAKDDPRKNYTDTKSVPDATKSLLADPLGGMDPADPEQKEAKEQVQKLDAKLKTQNVPKEVQAALDKNRDTVKKFMEAQLDFAANYLKDYMIVFAGKEEAGKITAKDVKVTYLPDNVSTPYKIKKYENYQIPALTDEQVRQKKVEMLKDMQKDPKGKEYVFRNMCFKIGYSVNLGK